MYEWTPKLSVAAPPSTLASPFEKKSRNAAGIAASVFTLSGMFGGDADHGALGA
ncbi:hypothetical protein D3C83_126740 [compost metagenome]